MAHDSQPTPGEPPSVRDDAADSPLWLPAAGLALLLLGSLFLVWRGASDDAVAPTAEEAAHP